MILSLQNLSVLFSTSRGVTKAVDNISFSLRKGETLGIVGESGSGKSVTSMTIMGLLPKSAIISNGELKFSSAQFGNVDLLKVSERKFQKIRGKEIAMIFQEPMSALNPVYTCGRQVFEMIAIHETLTAQKIKKKVISLFEQVELPRPDKIYDAYPHQLSGGQKQRVMIAMAMACNPKLLIADEPTTALDVTVQKEIIQLIKKLQRDNNMSVIFITHDLGLISEVADNVLVMYRGKQVEYGPTHHLFHHPTHPYTKGLLACRPTLKTNSKKLLTVSDFMFEDKNGQIIEKHPAETEKQKKQTLGTETILQVNQLTTRYILKKSYWGKPLEYLDAVNNVTFDVKKGETIGLVGESGCGKSTLGKTILKLIEAHSGSILYKGEDITNASKKRMRLLRKELQIIFQDPYSSLNPKMTVGDLIIEPMKVNHVLTNYKQRKEKAIELLETVGLSSAHLQRYPHEFSGGQRQRICVARTLALNPKIIICDESVSALDVSVQAQVLNLLNDLKEKFNFTYIFISHDLSVVKFMADRLIIMKEGKIVEQGNAEEIYQNAQSDYTKKLIESIPEGIVT